MHKARLYGSLWCTPRQDEIRFIGFIGPEKGHGNRQSLLAPTAPRLLPIDHVGSPLQIAADACAQRQCTK